MNNIRYAKPNLPEANSEGSKSLQNFLNEILKTGWVSQGEKVGLLAEKLKEIHDVKYVIPCASCTAGLTIAMKAAGFQNKKVVLPAFTWPSTLYAIESVRGTTPLFGDISKETLLLDQSSILEEYDCIVPVNIFGTNALQFSTVDFHSKPMVIDAAHSFGDDQLLSEGDHIKAAVISFSFSKVVTAIEGGAILTNDKEIYTVCSELVRLAARMSEIHAAIALESIACYEQSDREHIYSLYKNGIKDANIEGINNVGLYNSHNQSVIPIIFDSEERRNAHVQSLRLNDIETKIYYEPLVRGLPATEHIYSRIMCVPSYTGVEKEVPHIINLMSEVKTDIAPGKQYFEKSGYVQRYLK